MNDLYLDPPDSMYHDPRDNTMDAYIQHCIHSTMRDPHQLGCVLGEVDVFMDGKAPEVCDLWSKALVAMAQAAYWIPRADRQTAAHDALVAFLEAYMRHTYDRDAHDDWLEQRAEDDPRIDAWIARMEGLDA